MGKGFSRLTFEVGSVKQQDKSRQENYRERKQNWQTYPGVDQQRMASGLGIRVKL